MKRLSIPLFFVCLLFLLLTQSHARVWAKEQAPLGPHCIETGPLPLDDPAFCGCTWGYVYYRGQPLLHAPVALTFQTQITATVSKPSVVDPVAYYALSGAPLGAKLADTMTVTTTIAGQAVTRAFRARPDQAGEQEVPIVIPEQGEWQLFLTASYTRTLLVQGQTLWAGGPAGLLRVDRTTGAQTVQSLPWADSSVTALAASPNTLWAAGAHHLASYDGQQWQERTPPFAATIRTLIVQPTTGALWVGGGDAGGALAVYTDQWHIVNGIAQPITTLTWDSDGKLWVGAWGGGVYRQMSAGDPQSAWQQFRIGDGLASDYIYVAIAEGQQLWFGTRPYIAAQGAQGGISRYDLATNQWQRFGLAQGLPADPILTTAPASVFALAADANGLLWAGTSSGVHLLATPSLWLTDTVAGSPVRALATAGQTVIAAQADGAIRQLDRTVTPGAPPTAQINNTGASVLVPQDTLTLTASAQDPDADNRILAWDWQSDRDGSLCTTINQCTLSAALLSLGIHTITLRVQDDEGVWSPPVTTTVAVEVTPPRRQLYLPLVARQ